MNIYIVGPLFCEAEVAQRKLEGKLVKELMDSYNIAGEIFNPIDMPLNSNINVTSSEIASADYDRLSKSDVVFFDLSNEDPGSLVALGLIIEKLKQGKSIKIYPVFSDIRLSRNYSGGLESSLGYNSMVVGILKNNNIKIFNRFKDALKEFERSL